jgi:hypothetical protein
MQAQFGSVSRLWVAVVLATTLGACVSGSSNSGSGYATATGTSSGGDGTISGDDTATNSSSSGGDASDGPDAAQGAADSLNTGSSGGDAAAGGSSSGADATGNAPPPSDAILKQHGITKMEMLADKVETASKDTDDKGVAVFYSPHHNALVEINTLNNDDKKNPAAAAKMQVRVRVEQSGAIWALVIDPSGKMAPAVHQGGLTDGTIEINGEDAMADGTLEAAWAPDQVNPFPKKFALIGITVSMVIRFSLRTMIGMAIGAAVKSFVNKTCVFANPLYTGWCNTISDLAKELSGVVVSGIKMKFADKLNWKSLASEALTNVANYFIQDGCEKATGGLLIAIGPTSNNPWPLYDANVGLWKKVNHKVTYMMNKEVSAPPANAAKKAMIKPLVRSALKFLTLVRPMVQKDVYLTHSSETPSKISDGKPYTFTTKMIEHIVDELKTVVTEVQLTTIISSVTFYKPLWNGLLVQNKTFVLQQLQVRKTTSPWKPKFFSQSLSCALGAIDGFGGYLSGSTAVPVPYQTMQYVNDALQLVDWLLDKGYGYIWGGGIAAPTCYPDLYEPNNKYNVGQNVKNLGSKVTIGDVTSTKGDVDWYTLPLLGAWAKVQAGVAGRKPKGSSDCNSVPAGAKLCVSMWWHSNIIDLTGTGPVQIGSEGCGAVSNGDFIDPEFSVPWWNVSKVTGEQNQKLLVRVRQPTGQNLDIPYSVMMFAGSIF